MKKTLLSALKHGSGILLTLFSLLLSCQVWAAWTGILYFDNSATQWSSVGAIFGHDSFTRVYRCTQVSGTDVWYISIDNTWGDEKYIYFFNSSQSTYDKSSVNAASYAAGFQDRNITVNQINTEGGGSALGGKIMIPQSSEGRSAGTTWVAYNALDYTSISGNGRLIPTNGYSFDGNMYAYINVSGPLSNANYGENSGTLKAWYEYTNSEKTAGVVVASAYIGYNSSDNRYLYRFRVEDGNFTYLKPLKTDAPVGQTTWPGDDYRYYSEKGKFKSAYGASAVYVNLDESLTSDDTPMSGFTSLSSPSISSSTSFGLLGSTFTITLTKGASGTFSGGDICRVYATDGTNLYEVCQPKSADAAVNWTPITAGDWTLYAITTDKYGAERRKSTEISVKVRVSCNTPDVKSVSINPSTVCSGSNVTITVANSQDSYIYKVYDNASVPALMANAVGTGSDLPVVFASRASAEYTVKAVQYDGCPETTSMSNTVSVNVNATPVLTATPSSVTNYAPVTITASGAEINSWNITSGTGGYLYKKSATSAKFKGNVGSGSAVTYTIEGTANGCSGTATVTVNSNSDNCQ